MTRADDQCRAGGIVARLESGRISVAVEFRAGEGMPTYAVIPLLVDGGRAHTVATDTWSDIHRHAPPDGNE